MEGVAGIVDWSQCRGPGQPYEEGRRLLLGEVNAAIDGAMAGGATEIVCTGPGGQGHLRPAGPVCRDGQGQAWTPATLKEVGGTEGVGVTFLEETFSASCPARTACTRRRLGRFSRRCCRSREPTSRATCGPGRICSTLRGTAAVPGSSRSCCGSSTAKCGSSRRLIRKVWMLRGWSSGEPPQAVPPREQPSPTPPEGGTPTGEKYYQLTHDYLVPSLREWLTRKQKETRKGRAELRLADRAALWTAKPENRHLPAWWEWANIRLFTRKRDWTSSQRKMMRTATPLSCSAWRAAGGVFGRAELGQLGSASAISRPEALAAIACSTPTRPMCPRSSPTWRAYRRWVDRCSGWRRPGGRAPAQATAPEPGSAAG